MSSDDSKNVVAGGRSAASKPNKSLRLRKPADEEDEGAKQDDVMSGLRLAMWYISKIGNPEKAIAFVQAAAMALGVASGTPVATPCDAPPEALDDTSLPGTC